MSKRSSRANRRPPIRRPIPDARLHSDQPATTRATARPTDLTEQHLVDGWDLDGGLRVRHARAEDMPAVRELSKLAGVDLEPEVTAAVETGVAAAGLRAGLRGGRDEFNRHVGEQLFAHQGGEQSIVFQHLTLVLVAENEQGIVAALVAYPPVSVISRLLRHNKSVGAGQRQAMQILLMGATAIARIKALAVAEPLRGTGIGAALLQRCQQIFDQCDYLVLYGQAPPTPGLDRFYGRHGFEVLRPGEGFDAWVVFGVHADIHADPAERIFIRWRAGRQRAPRSTR